MKKIVLLVAGILITSIYSQAQTAIKLGHINSTELLTSMPEMTKADNDLKAFAKGYQDQLETMAKEYDKKLGEYQAGAKTFSEAVREVKEKELMDLQKRIETTEQSATDKVSKKKEEIYKPILDKANGAIQAVAKEKGYTYVFDSSIGALLFANDSDNIIALVKAKLGIK